MEKEIKYTTDGKKVVVLGSLNSQEKIVQEVFIIDGSEIPSGEHFVVKTLHDAPAISWQEKKLNELQLRYESYEKEIKELDKKYRESCGLLSEKLKYIGSVLKKADEKSFDTLVKFITGKTKWIVVDIYEPKILPIEDFHRLYDERLRLISLFGKDDGTFTYKQSYYHDGSGCDQRFYPFEKHEDAIEKFKEVVLSKKISDSNINSLKKYGFNYPDDVLNNYIENKIKLIKEEIDKHKNGIVDCEAEINELLKNKTACD